MKKIFFTLAAAFAALTTNAQTQLYNSDFEQWEEVSYTFKPPFGKEKTLKSDEPLRWSSFLDATGNLKSIGAAVQIYKDIDVRPGSAGTYSARIKANSVYGVVAQGNLTNGCVNMGSINATDAANNYNYINEDREDQAMRFSGRPKSLKVWMKGSCQYDASIAVHLVTKGYYQDPMANKDKITAIAVGKAVEAIAVTNEWTQYEVNFEYDAAVNDEPYYALVTFSTSATPGKGNNNDVLYIDDMEMIYPDAPASLIGDVNNDGAVNKTDADLIVDHYLGKDVEINTENADVNNDNKISVADANEIINK